MATVTYRPNGAGSNTHVDYQSPESDYHWDKVDDVSPDESSTYINTYSETYQLDTYAFQDPGESGIINSITVYARCKQLFGFALSKVAIYTSGQVAKYGSENSLSTSWTTYSKTWTTNPWTSSPWSWSDMNALEIGVALCGAGGACCTQVYIVIDYTPSSSGQVRFIGMMM